MSQGRFEMMTKLAVAAAIAAAVTSTAYAQQPQSTTTGPAPSAPLAQLTHYYIINYYKQNVYDSSGANIAEVADVLVGKDGKIEGFIMSVSGLSGIDEKTVAVPFDAVKSSQQNGSMRLTMNTTKDQLEKAPAFKFDTAFAQQNQNTTTGQSQSTTTGVTTSAHAQVLTTVPNNATTVTNYYKQNVYDDSDAKIAEITDVLIGQDHKIDGFIMSVGGFLGIGEKNVAVPFDAVKATQVNGNWRLTMDATKDQLQMAPGFKYDRANATWVPA
jgi:sporulation protein YlmC with PRC-barrel domain